MKLMPTATPRPRAIVGGLTSLFLSFLACSGRADAAIIHSGVLDELLLMDDFDVLYVDLDDDGNTDFQLEAFRNNDFEDEYPTKIDFYSDQPGTSYAYQATPYVSESQMARLTAGNTIGAATLMSFDNFAELYDSYQFPAGERQFYTEWKDGMTGYIGFSFIASTTGERHYGWAELAIDTSGDEARLVQWAWESTPLTTILAGDAGEGPPPPPGFPVDDLSLQFELARTDGADGMRWLAFPYLRTNDGEWTEPITVSSPNESFRGFINDPEGVTSSSVNFNSLASLRDAMTGTWTIRARIGGAEAVLTFPVEASGLSASVYPEFGVTSPLRDQTVGGPEFAATWTAPTTGTWPNLRLSLANVIRGDGPFPKYTSIVNTSLDATATQYSQTLDYGEKRLTVAYSNPSVAVPGLVVGDLAGAPPVAWSVTPTTVRGTYEAFFFVGDGGTTRFRDWADDFFTPEEMANPAVSGPFGSAMGDGLANVVKYAFGFASPATYESTRLPQLGKTVPVEPSDPVFATLIFTVRDDDSRLNWRVEVSDNATNWNFNGDPSGVSHTAIQTIPNGDGTTTVTARALRPLGGAPVFMRVAVGYDD
jgi:hypothetical protein